ncbi:MAG TPA: bacteriohemerythrin [Steroidobacteraceae bacterium]
MSELFKWDPAKYCIQVPQMDGEHEIIVGHMNKVHSLYQEKAAREVIGGALNDFVAYTKKHFADEEAYMETIDFPDRRVHCAMHRQLLARVDHFAQKFATTGTLPDELFVFLKTWLRAHICGIDSKYAAHARTG